MIFRIHPGSGVPIYLQLVQQVTHAIETGALRSGDQLPPIRGLAEDVVTNPNTVAKAYRELEYRGVIELRQGLGAFVRANTMAEGEAKAIQRAQRLMADALGAAHALGLSEPVMRRIFEAELMQVWEATEEVPKRR